MILRGGLREASRHQHKQQQQQHTQQHTQHHKEERNDAAQRQEWSCSGRSHREKVVSGEQRWLVSAKKNKTTNQIRRSRILQQRQVVLLFKRRRRCSSARKVTFPGAAALLARSHLAGALTHHVCSGCCHYFLIISLLKGKMWGNLRFRLDTPRVLVGCGSGSGGGSPSLFLGL